MDDPYCWPGTDCLKNKLGITDPDKLFEAEARLVSVRDVQAARTTIPGNYGVAHLRRFHEVLFGDVYAWAGQTRTVDIGKGQQRFCHWRYVDDQAAVILSDLAVDGYLIGLKAEPFLRLLANYYGELNVCHPFREGNGRTIRAFLRQVAAAAGYQLDWSELDRDSNIEACRMHMQTTDTGLLIESLRRVVGQ